MIIESIVTTQNAAGAVNVAPMGVEWPADSGVLILKPFLDTTTFRNVRETGAAVVNLTDDVRVYARAALSVPGEPDPTSPAVIVDGVVLDAACSWHEVEVVAVDATPPRARIEARVVHHGTRREFLGFNRARHAVLEATILATRLHLIPHDQVLTQVQQLQVLVDKTAGPRELEAWTVVTTYINSHTNR